MHAVTIGLKRRIIELLSLERVNIPTCYWDIESSMDLITLTTGTCVCSAYILLSHVAGPVLASCVFG
jgi:hypothetical protein